MRITQTSDLWWKNAVVYCADVESFLDTDGSGRGDLVGMSQRVDHLAQLGVTCLWLMPFYPSPDRDDGYDITDYYAVDPRLGTLGDLVELVRTARDRGIRVIADLVVNHTSHRHPWFTAARASRDSPYRDWYVWADSDPGDTGKLVAFPDQETSLWQWDEKAGQFYLHQFYKAMPDLDVTNPAVRDEIAKIVGFWLQLGLSGFRVDAVPALLDETGVDRGDRSRLPDPHAFLRSLRAFLGRRTGDAILLGEVNLPFDQQREFFGGEAGDELTMQFDFMTMQAMYLALARHDAAPIAASIDARPPIPRTCQWATFVRNHDELTLDKLTGQERAEVFAAFGPDPDMQLYGHGLRRRLPPMLDGDPRRIRMVYSLLFSLPGTPVLFYGEEIGMGENLAVPDRYAVRTPMQRTAGENGGFSTAPARRLVRPVPTDGFSPAHVNVADQRGRTDSLLSSVTRLAQRYRDCPELGWGTWTVLDQPEPAVLAARSDLDDGTVLTVHHLGPAGVTVPISLPGEPAGTVLVVLAGDSGGTGASLPVPDDGAVELQLEGYGHAWFRVVRPGDTRLV